MSSETISQKSAVELWYGARKQGSTDPLATAASESTAGETGTGMKIAIQGEPGSFSHEAALEAGFRCSHCALLALRRCVQCLSRGIRRCRGHSD